MSDYTRGVAVPRSGWLRASVAIRRAEAAGWDVTVNGQDLGIYPTEAEALAAALDHHAASSGTTTGETMRKDTPDLDDLDLIDDLDKTVDVARLLPGLLVLAKDVSFALADGRITIGEMFRIGRSLVRLVQDVRR